MGNLGMELVLCPGPSPTWILTELVSHLVGVASWLTRQKRIDLSSLTGDEGAPWLQILWYPSLKARGGVTHITRNAPIDGGLGAHPRIRQRTSSISDLHTYDPHGFAQQLSKGEGSFPWRVSKFTSNSVGGRISFLYWSRQGNHQFCSKAFFIFF